MALSPDIGLAAFGRLCDDPRGGLDKVPAFRLFLLRLLLFAFWCVLISHIYILPQFRSLRYVCGIPAARPPDFFPPFRVLRTERIQWPELCLVMTSRARL